MLFFLLTLLLNIVAILLFLLVGTFFFMFLDRFVRARVQHRDGPSLDGKINYLQVWKDYRKIREKMAVEVKISKASKRLFLIWISLPALFLLVLLGNGLPKAFDSASFAVLLLLPLVSIGLESGFLNATGDSAEKDQWRRGISLRIIGVSLFSLGFLAVLLRVGAPSLEKISQLQKLFPYVLLASGPGLFVSAFSALGAIFVFARSGALEGESNISLGGGLHFPIFFTNKMWVISLLSFWVYVFAGGFSGPVEVFLFPFKIILASFCLLLIQLSVPSIKSVDLGERAIHWVLRMALLGFALEAIWLGVIT